MSQPSGKPIYIPPFSGVRLVEYREHFQLVPVPEVKVFYGYGKVKARYATVDPDDPNSEQIWSDLKPDEEVWIAMEWCQFEDGKQVPGNTTFSRPDSSELHVKNLVEDLKSFSKLNREQLLKLAQCFEAKDEDYDYIDDKCPNYQSEPDRSDAENYDVYHARLKVMAELSPKTVELLKIADVTKDPGKRKFVEREAVQSYFAELAAHYFTEDEILAWQKSNPVGTGWMCEFASVKSEPRRQLDPANHELALNWLRQKYNEMTAKELADTVYERVLHWVADRIKFSAEFIKKRRERLGLTTKRPSGPPPKSESQ